MALGRYVWRRSEQQARWPAAFLDEPVTIPQQADLPLSKTVSNPTPNVGNTISYTVTLTDNGPDAATNAQVTDLLAPRA